MLLVQFIRSALLLPASSGLAFTGTCAALATNDATAHAMRLCVLACACAVLASIGCALATRYARRA